MIKANLPRIVRRNNLLVHIQAAVNHIRFLRQRYRIPIQNGIPFPGTHAQRSATVGNHRLFLFRIPFYRSAQRFHGIAQGQQKLLCILKIKRHILHIFQRFYAAFFLLRFILCRGFRCRHLYFIPRNQRHGKRQRPCQKHRTCRRNDCNLFYCHNSPSLCFRSESIF